MKHVLWVAAFAIGLAACGGNNSEKEAEQADTTVAAVEVQKSDMKYGADITEDGATPASEVMAQLQGKDSVRTKLVGTIEKVCQVKGCWMTMKVNDEQNMHVSFKDYGFFVPMDIDGSETVIEGYAYMETMSVDDLRHYAEDAGKSQEEIDQIIEPETKLSFVADGVIVKDYTPAAADEEEKEEEHDHHEGHDHGDHVH